MRPADLLELDWEVSVFRAVRALWRRVAPERLPYDPRRAALLVDLVPTLGPLAQLVAGEAVRLLPARAEGGVRGRDLLVPAAIDLLPDAEANRGLYVLRVVHAAVVRRITVGRVIPVDDVELLRANLDVAVRAANLASTELDRFGEAWGEACAAVLASRPVAGTLAGRAEWIEALRCEALRGELVAADDPRWESLRRARTTGPESAPIPLWGALVRSDAVDESTGATVVDARHLPDGTEHAAPPVEALRRVLLDPDEQDEKVLQHTFEKVETADAWDGNVQCDDGADELDEHLEALDEVDLRDLIRGGQDAHSIYKADIDVGADIPDVERIAPGEAGIPYDEWDWRAREYRVGWCTVYPTRIEASAPSWATEPLSRHRRLVGRLVRRLEDHRSALDPLDRQLDGEHPDIDALVDHLAETRAGRTGSGRLYVRQQRRRRDIVATVLLDLSLSSDAWVDDRRVLDVEREAVLVFGEVAERLGDRISVLAFASSTRNRCRVWTVKGWDEPWAAGRARLGALEPQGYTRIGPALRHATADLARTPADRRLLLLLSDGKPNDYDRYEGRYGMADVRMALREAEQRGVCAHALAVDATARGWLPSMFGPARWHVLPTPDHLLAALTEVYGRLTGGST